MGATIPRCFSIWMAGGGIKRGLTYGETDEFSYNIVTIQTHDLHATILHCLGVDISGDVCFGRHPADGCAGNVLKNVLA
jgi:hypothetical protein